MRVIVGQAERGPVISAGIVAAALGILTLNVVAGSSPLFACMIAIPAVVLTVGYRALLSWKSLISGMILVIMFVPIKRYELPGGLPFDLELYRVYVGLVLIAWFTSLLIDPRVRLRASGFETSIGLLLVATIASEVPNAERISDGGLHGQVIKAQMFFLSFLLVFYLIVSVVRTRELLDFLVKLLVGCGAVVAISAIYESRTGYNVFEHLETVLPFLSFVHDQLDVNTRQGGLRVFGSAQSPIALGAMLVMLIPLALYLAVAHSKRWWCAVAVMGIATLATVSRTPVLMLMIVMITYLLVRPRVVLRMWPFLIPAVAASQVLTPGAVGSLRASFFPPGGLIAEQSQHAGWGGSGRVADLKPAFKEWRERPLLGQGYGTRSTDRKDRKDQILDDQWLKTLLENGAVGIGAWVLLYLTFFQRLGRAARRDKDDVRGWLPVGVLAGVAAFSVSMFLYDTFSFIQVTLVLFMLLAFGATYLRITDIERQAARKPA
jgi:O-Antigen ligase